MSELIPQHTRSLEERPPVQIPVPQEKERKIGLFRELAEVVSKYERLQKLILLASEDRLLEKDELARELPNRGALDRFLHKHVRDRYASFYEFSSRLELACVSLTVDRTPGEGDLEYQASITAKRDQYRVGATVLRQYTRPLFAAWEIQKQAEELKKQAAEARREQGIAQAQQYQETSRISGPICDGFIDGGRAVSLDKSGAVPIERRTREVIIVDRELDPSFREREQFLKQETAGKTLQQKLFMIAQYVFAWMGADDQGILDVDDRRVSTKEDLYIGSLSKKSPGTCRHRALAFQAIAAECGIVTSLVRGFVDMGNGILGPHVWNEIFFDGRWYIVDATNPPRPRAFESMTYQEFLELQGFPCIRQVQTSAGITHEMSGHPLAFKEYYDKNGATLYKR